MSTTLPPESVPPASSSNSRIAPPTNVSPSPDEFTKKNPDFTGDHAENRVLRFDFGWFKYGTDDKAHGSAVVLSILLLVLTLIITLIGGIDTFSGKEPDWIKEVVSWVGNAFLFTAGVALGKSGKGKSD